MKDILIPVRNSEENEQLRYTLRSLKNIPHGRVFICGFKPKWVKNVVYVPTRQDWGTRFYKAAYNVYRGCLKDISEEFLYFYDDTYLTRKVEDIEVYHRGDIKEVLESYGNRHSTYLSVMRNTLQKLEDNNLTTISYELHIPMPMNKYRFIDTWDFMNDKRIAHGSTRSVYGNLHQIGGKRIDDVKVYNYKQGLPKEPFFSTNHSVFPMVSNMYLKKMFPNPSPYEMV